MNLALNCGRLGYFGTKLAPKSNGLYVFDFLICQSLHEAFFTTEQGECRYIHAIQLLQSFCSFTHRECVFCQHTLDGRIIRKGILVAPVLVAVADIFPANGVFALLSMVSLMAHNIG